MKKFMLRIMPVVIMMVMVVTTSVYAIDPREPSGGSAISGVTNVANNIWATVAAIVQILAVAAVIIAGVRYMFASADAKADIKQQTVILIVGAILVFAAVPLLQFIQNVARDALN